MRVLAHRCLTLFDIRMAYETGATAEFDVSETLDGIPIVYHPGTRTPDLVKINLREAGGMQFHILTLKKLFALLVELPGLECCLEIKQNSEKLVEKVVRMILLSGLEDRIYLTAFQRRIILPFIDIETSAKLLLHAKAIEPGIKTHIICTWPWNLPKLADKYNPDAISFGWLLEPRLVSLVSKFLFEINARMRDLEKQVLIVRAMGIQVWSGICNDREGMLYLMSLGVDGIMTDKPQLLKEIIREKQKAS